MLAIEPSTFVSKIDILTTTPIVHNWCSNNNNNNAYFLSAISPESS